MLATLSDRLSILYDEAKTTKNYLVVDRAKKLLSDHSVEARFARDGVVLIVNGTTDLSMLTDMLMNIS